ncbi:MAG: hypothetical protein WCH62_03220, partial [Candidatus Omnitrophota bacterium]
EVNLYFQTNSVEMNKTIFIFYCVMGVLFAVILLSFNLISHKIPYQKDGLGKETYSNGSTYEGNFKNGERSGHGKIIWKNGASQEGEYINGELNGKVVVRYVNGSFFEGECKNGYEYCKGLLHYKNGTQEQIEIRNGEFTTSPVERQQVTQ